MTRTRLYALVLLLTAAGDLWLGWNLYAESLSPAGCAFKSITGIPCPSCGTTRGVLFLLRGHPVESLLMNPFSWIVAGALIVLPLWIAVDLILRRDTFHRFYRAVDRIFIGRPWLAVFSVALVLMNWTWNIVKGF